MASYRNAVQWLADNEDGIVPEQEFGEIVSVVLVADLWNRPSTQVAADVFRLRKIQDKARAEVGNA